MELADTSAWTMRHRDPTVRDAFDAGVLAGEIATCDMVIMELLWTRQSPGEFPPLREELRALPRIPITECAWTRAMEVWDALVARGRHRQARQPDLLIAAAAELAGVGLCHYDRHFEVIAAATGQPQRAIAPIGVL